MLRTGSQQLIHQAVQLELEVTNTITSDFVKELMLMSSGRLYLPITCFAIAVDTCDCLLQIINITYLA